MKPPASRNAPCPCGSGRRYKECHGALDSGGLSNAARSDPRELIAQALDAVRRSDLSAAESAARAVEATDSRNPDAAHVLALIALARGRYAEATGACDRAIAVLPDHAPFHATRARALLGEGRHREAEQSARRALALAPRDAGAWTLLGRALLASDALADSPRTDARRESGDVAAAEAAWRSAIALDPANAEALFYLGNAARERGESAAAIGIYEQALVHHPRDAQLLNNLGLALEHSGDLEAAKKRYEEALAVHDAPVEAHANLARLLESIRDFPAAAVHYHIYATTAVDAPADIWARLAQCQQRVGALASAEESYRKALEREPANAEIQYGLAALLVELGRSAEAIAILDALRQTIPSGRVLHALLCARLLICDWTEWEAIMDALRAHIARPPAHLSDTLIPLNALALPFSPAELLTVARRFADTYRDPQRPRERGRATPAAGRRLKIGYVSTDFRTHPIAYLLTELWESGKAPWKIWKEER